MSNVSGSLVPGMPSPELMNGIRTLLNRGDVPTNPMNQIPRINAQRQLVDKDGQVVGGGVVYTITPGGMNLAAAIQEANDDIAASGRTGFIGFSGDTLYELNGRVNIDASHVGILGGGAHFSLAGLPNDEYGFRFFTSAVVGELAQYPQCMPLHDLSIYGNPEGDRDTRRRGILFDSATVGSQVRVDMQRVAIRNAEYGIVVGSRAPFVRGHAVEIHSTKYALHQLPSATDFAEGLEFSKSIFGNNDCHLWDNGGNRWKFNDTSFDYHGARGNAWDAIFDLRAGATVEVSGRHFEWNYSGSRVPIRMTGANTMLSIKDAKIIYTGTRSASLPGYQAFISTDNNSQLVILRDLYLRNMGRVSAPLHEDQLVIGATADRNGACATVISENLYSQSIENNDLPSVIGYEQTVGVLRNGVDNPHSELSPRIEVTGTAAVASAASGTDGVTARNGIGSMLRLTGTGKVIISFENYQPRQRHAWSMFINGTAGVGTMTVRERHSTACENWNGTTIVLRNDTRNVYSSVTHNATVGGANEWRRCSWKDVNGNTITSRNVTGAVWCIEIDIALSSGAVYIDDVALTMM